MRGITIVELIVSMIIVMIMMAGILSANYAIQKMDKNVSTKSALSLRTMAMADLIKDNVSRAQGTVNDVGVCLNTTNDNANYFCFRNDISGTLTWICYTRLNASGLSVGTRLFKCSHGSSGLTGNNPYSCNAGGQAACTTGDEEIGSIAFDVFSFAAPTFDSNGFSMPLINRLVPASAYSIDNPEVRMWVSAYPNGQNF